MKKRLFPLLLALLFTLSACGGAGSGDASSASAAAGDMPMDTNGWAESADTADGGSADFSAVRQNAKLILRADLTLETQDFDATSADLEKLTAETGGYIESSSLSGDKGSRSAYYTLRIPQEKFETFYAQLGDRAHVVYSSRSSEDITEQYTDIETRLATLQTKHERLLALLDQAGKMEDIISLDEVQTLTATPEGSGFGAQLTQAAKTGTRGLVDSVRALILGIVMFWPVVLLLAAGGGAAIVITKKRRKKREAEWAAQAAQPAQPLVPPEKDEKK